MNAVTTLSSPPAEPALEASPQPAAGASKESTHGQILKSTALVGGSQVLNIAIGIVRTKAMAMLLGPAGFGLDPGVIVEPSSETW